jgi:hypothetical protein
MKIPRLSVCMIVKNEEAHLARCLASVAPLGAQVVVVDTGSTDRSVAIAREHGAEVSAFEWTQNFSAARNAGLERARGAWTLVLDADEWLENAAQQTIAQISLQSPECAYALVQKSQESGGGSVRNWIVRLFPNRPDIRYQHRIHEDVNGSLSRGKIPVLQTEITIEHSGYEDPVALKAKVERNRRILEETLQEPLDKGAEAHVRFNLGVERTRQGDISGALGEFEWCMRNAPVGSRTHVICKLKAAECLYVLQRKEEARLLLPQKPDPAQHPTEMLLMARILHEKDPSSALPWLETILRVPDRTQVYPVNLGAVKLTVVAQIGRMALERGLPQVALALIQLGKEMKEGRVDAASEAVAERYRNALNAAKTGAAARTVGNGGAGATE